MAAELAPFAIGFALGVIAQMAVALFAGPEE